MVKTLGDYINFKGLIKILYKEIGQGISTYDDIPHGVREDKIDDCEYFLRLPIIVEDTYCIAVMMLEMDGVIVSPDFINGIEASPCNEKYMVDVMSKSVSDDVDWVKLSDILKEIIERVDPNND